jgi:hypothetical protein
VNDERPPARPLEQPLSAPNVGDVSSAAIPPTKKRLGCFGIGCLGLIGLVVIACIISAVGGSKTSSGGSSNDPIEQARAVLDANYGESYSYSEIKSTTDQALYIFGLPQTDDYRSRAWSSVLTVVKEPELSQVSPMDVMRCVAADDETGGLKFTDMVALCAVSLK